MSLIKHSSSQFTGEQLLRLFYPGMMFEFNLSGFSGKLIGLVAYDPVEDESHHEYMLVSLDGQRVWRFYNDDDVIDFLTGNGRFKNKISNVEIVPNHTTFEYVIDDPRVNVT